MTKHRKPEEWIEEILEAAADELVSSGYSKFTMEALATRTGLSKGGVYRFFSNKRDVALALFTRHYRRMLKFEIAEVLSRDESIAETLHSLLFAPSKEQKLRRDQIVWVQLVGEILRDDDFLSEREHLVGLLQDKFNSLVIGLVNRNGLRTDEPFQEKIKNAVTLGIALMEGMAIRGCRGETMNEQAALFRQFVEGMVCLIYGARDGQR